MGRGPAAEEIPGLAHALRHLRERAGLTQREVAERVTASGGRLSAVYYQQLESGRRFPSPRMRARLLAALGADETTLSRLLAERPWAAAAQAVRGTAVTGAVPAPAPVAWADAIAPRPAPPAAAPRDSDRRPPQPVVGSATPAPGLSEGTLSADERELLDLWRRIDPGGRAALRAVARELARAPGAAST